MVGTAENRGPQLAAVDYTFGVLALTTILMRCAVRVFIVRGFGVDDWLMLGAAVTFTLYCGFSLTGVHYGTGQHEDALDRDDVSSARMYWWLCYLMYCSTMILSKISIGYQILRVAVRKLHMWIVYGAITTTIVTCIAFFLVTVLQCQPVSFFWNKNQSGTCVNMNVIIGLVYLYSVCAIITDLIFALLPAWIIIGLQLKRRTKIALIPLMAMGCIASGAVMARAVYLPRFRDPDFLWATLDIAIWSSVEQGLAISAGSLATLRPLLKLVGWKLGLTGRLSGLERSRYGELGSSRTGQLSSRPTKSQTITGMDSARGNDDDSKMPSSYPASYIVRCEADSTEGEAELRNLPHAIAHGKTYEISSEYISHDSTIKPWPPSSKGAQDGSYLGKDRVQRSGSTKWLRSQSSEDTMYEQQVSSI